MGLKHFSLILLALFGAGALEAREKETVVLLHGILNKPFFMKKIEGAFIKEGYEVVNWGYPSTEKTIEEHAKDLDKSMQSLRGKKIHFVAFSLGSILVRYYLRHYPGSDVGRFVMIAPPNHGSEMVDKLYSEAWFRWIYGDKSIEQLQSSNSEFLVKECGIPQCEFGIIAGGLGDGKGFNPLLKGDNDGTVPVESAHLEGAKDFVLLPYEHTALIFSDKTSRNAVHFIRNGKFIHKDKKIK